MERKRSERTGADFLLVLVNIERLAVRNENPSVEAIEGCLISAIRDTDIAGWYQSNCTIGVIFTALNGAAREGVQRVISEKLQNVLSENLHVEQIQRIEVSFHFFPEQSKPGKTYQETAVLLYPTNQHKALSDKFFIATKRTLDVVASLAALIVLSPAFLFISAGIKLTSAGPVFFRQKRLGKYGAEFTFLKFRSMIVANDPQIHKQYTANLIRGGRTDKPGPVYKIQNDPRVTQFGRLLRVTSLDELPQFINVLAGDMSLVGPRPPIPYEYEHYQLWHRRRVLEAKPGITGIWQVSGRSRTTFDQMVRMDLQYIRNRSLWLDLKILVKTPFAVLSGDGAF